MCPLAERRASPWREGTPYRPWPSWSDTLTVVSGTAVWRQAGIQALHTAHGRPDTVHFVARYLFLFDKVVIVCKRKGYSYELKEVIELLFHKMTDDPMHNKDIKKVGPGLERGRVLTQSQHISVSGGWACWPPLSL